MRPRDGKIIRGHGGHMQIFDNRMDLVCIALAYYKVDVWEQPPTMKWAFSQVKNILKLRSHAGSG